MITIISGGQTGADRGGLDAALHLGIPHGGWCPAGRRAEDGEIPDRYALLETRERDYRVRTRRNIADADGTLVFGRGALGSGSRFTVQCARERQRPCLVVDLVHAPAPDEIRAWLKIHRVAVLNVAGARESGAPGIQGEVRDLLLCALA